MAVQLLSGPGGGVLQQAAIPVGTSFAVAGIPAGSYTVRVIGTGPAGVSAPSNAVTFAVPGCGAAAPLPLAVDTSAAVSLQWPAVPGAAGYRLDVASAPGGPLIGSFPFPPSQTAVSSSAAIGTYYVRLHAPPNCGATASSAEQAVQVTRVNPVNWSKDEWRAWFFNLVASRGLPNATLVLGHAGDAQRPRRARRRLPERLPRRPARPHLSAGARLPAADLGERPGMRIHPGGGRRRERGRRALELGAALLIGGRRGVVVRSAAMRPARALVVAAGLVLGSAARALPPIP